MSEQHQPGPWIAYKRPQPVGYAEWEIHYGTDTECIAEVVHHEGNARLIAAAPDLLAALESLLNNRGHATIGQLQAARDAVEKATGDQK